jgi:glutamate racemase
MNGFLGIVDWGIGGLGLYKLIRQQTDIPVIYFSDAGHLPYGCTPTRQLHDRLDEIFQHLFGLGASHIAIACNAASAAYDDTDKVNGIINHGVAILKSIDPHWQKVGLLAGRSTVYSHIFPNRLGPHDYHLRQRVSQPLSAHVEAGRLRGPALHDDLRQILAPLRDCDGLLLACTHYPAIADQIAQYLKPQCQLIDPAEKMAEWIFQNWQFAKGSPPDQWYTSGAPDQLVTNGKRAFGIDIPPVKQVQV